MLRSKTCASGANAVRIFLIGATDQLFMPVQSLPFTIVDHKYSLGHSQLYRELPSPKVNAACIRTALSPLLLI